MTDYAANFGQTKSSMAALHDIETDHDIGCDPSPPGAPASLTHVKPSKISGLPTFSMPGRPPQQGEERPKRQNFAVWLRDRGQVIRYRYRGIKAEIGRPRRRAGGNGMERYGMPESRNSAARVNCFSCQARDRTEWCVLNDTDLTVLNDSKLVKEYMPGEPIFHQGDPCRGVHCFETGMIGIRKIDADGNSVLLGLAYPGDTIGYRSLLAEEEHKVSAEALKPSTVCFIDQNTVRRMLDLNPALGLRFLKRAARDLGEAEDRFMQSVTLSVRARFAHLLLVLKGRYAEAAEDGTLMMELPLSRQDMASMIGVRPETMSRTIRQFEDDGIAHFSGRTVRLLGIGQLLDEIEEDHTL